MTRDMILYLVHKLSNEIISGLAVAYQKMVVTACGTIVVQVDLAGCYSFLSYTNTLQDAIQTDLAGTLRNLNHRKRK